MPDTASQGVVYLFGPYAMDPVRRSLSRMGEPVSMTPRVFDALLCLVRGAGQIVGRTELIRAVWGSRIVDEANLKQTIYELRKALEPGAGERLIHTVPGRGYTLAAPVRTEAAAPACNGGAAPVAERPDGGSSKPRRLAMLVAGLGVLVLGTAVWSQGGRLGLPAPAETDAPALSVAVLPFTGGGEAGKSELADGIANEVINGLARIPSLHVAARTSSFLLRGGALSAGEIARRLNVGKLLEGSVRESSGQLHVAAQLIDGGTGYVVWSHAYDGRTADLFTLQAQIVQDVAPLLGAAPDAIRMPQTASGGTHVPAAYDAYLRGVKLSSMSETPSAEADALKEFTDAVALDPHFAAALADHARALVFTSGERSGYDPARMAATMRDAGAEADHALVLAPRLAEAHLARFDILEQSLDFAGAMRELAVARSDAPGDIEVLLESVYFQISLGHPDRARAEAERGVSLDPLSAPAYIALAWAQRALHDDSGAMASVQRARYLGADLDPQAVEASIAMERGENLAALKDCAHFGHWRDYICLAIVEQRLGHAAEARRNFDALRAMLGDGGAYQYAEIYAQWQQVPEALRWLQTAYRLHDAGLVSVQSDPLMAPIRGRPEYVEVVRKLRFPG